VESYGENVTPCNDERLLGVLQMAASSSAFLQNHADCRSRADPVLRNRTLLMQRQGAPKSDSQDPWLSSACRSLEKTMEPRLLQPGLLRERNQDGVQLHWSS